MNYSSPNIRMWSRLGSCGAYGHAALELPKINENVVLCTADLSYYSGIDRFKEKYPDRLYNVGIAEQNLIGIAAGLAKEGYNPFVSTYASFATTRALDQVRVNMSYMRLPIKLVGLTAGLSVGILGATHMSIEDVAIMRALPNITILSPADTTEAVKTILALANYDKPTYVRLTGTMGSPLVYKEDFEYKIDRANIIKRGKDVAFIASGSMVVEAIKAAELLENAGISCSVLDMQVIKPIDKESLLLIGNHDLWVTVEEHTTIGGLGDAVANFLVEAGERASILKIGINDFFPHASDYKFIIEQCGLTSAKIEETVRKKLEV